VQHEVDHLLGIFYPMCIEDLRNFAFVEELFRGQEISDD
jgi:peptide deformylase